jgi:hypothetical protein
MARRKTLTDRMVARMKPGAKRITMPDPELRGHYLRITPKGAKSFVAVARDPGGRQVWTTIGGADVLTIAEARETAREVIQRVKAGQPAFEAPPAKPDTLQDIAENWMQRHVRAKRLRTETEISRVLSKYIYPAMKDRDFETIGRADVTKLLDAVRSCTGTPRALMPTCRRLSAGCAATTPMPRNETVSSTTTKSAPYGQPPAKAGGMARS